MADVVPDASVDVAFDKSTLDAMIYGSPWDPPDEVVESTGRYIGEVRCLSFSFFFFFFFGAWKGGGLLADDWG